MLELINVDLSEQTGQPKIGSCMRTTFRFYSAFLANFYSNGTHLWLLGEQLFINIFKRLYFDGVTARIIKKQCRLFTNLPPETNIRLDLKFYILFFQSICQELPSIHFQYHTEMGYRHAMTINRVFVCCSFLLLTHGRVEMTHKLVSMEIEIDPVHITATFRAAHDVNIKVAGFIQIMDRYCQMKGIHNKNGKENFDFINLFQSKMKSKSFLPSEQSQMILETSHLILKTYSFSSSRHFV